MTPPGLRIRYAVCALAGLPFLNLSCSAPRRQPDRIRSNEKSFILRLKIIKTACDTYQIAYGSFPRSRPDPLPTSCGRLGGDVLRPHAPALPSPRPTRTNRTRAPKPSHAAILLLRLRANGERQQGV